MVIGPSMDKADIERVRANKRDSEYDPGSKQAPSKGNPRVRRPLKKSSVLNEADAGDESSGDEDKI